MANHNAAATALLLTASLLVAATLSGADARPTTVRPSKAVAAALHGSNTRLTMRRDMHGQGYVVDFLPPAGLLPPLPKKLTCHKVHEVQAGETCFSLGKGAGLSEDAFFSFNPNINCNNMFVGQWVCLQATSA